MCPLWWRQERTKPEAISWFRHATKTEAVTIAVPLRTFGPFVSVRELDTVAGVCDRLVALGNWWFWSVSSLWRTISGMITNMTMTKMLIGLCLGAVAAAAQEAKVTPLMTKELSGIPGQEATMVTVEYAPGASSSEHRHNAHVFVYVLEGTVVMQVKGGNEVTLAPGQTFYESPEDVHTVSRNASTTKPAKFLVFFVKQKGAPSTLPAK
jgi:quercetin dioxygenase-like cupin family protein